MAGIEEFLRIAFILGSVLSPIFIALTMTTIVKKIIK